MYSCCTGNQVLHAHCCIVVHSVHLYSNALSQAMPSETLRKQLSEMSRALAKAATLVAPQDETVSDVVLLYLLSLYQVFVRHDLHYNLRSNTLWPAAFAVAGFNFSLRYMKM